ncbi:MAG: ABC transporter ATP-binding protein [Ardenticatenales bacterium]|nr:ABC transporter ATP-binding protein [Ardenticatenales bacterium]
MNTTNEAAPDGDWMIEATDLVKRYGTFEALNGMTLRVGRGEIFGFLGPNGAGKTTTIRILTGLLQPTSGRARIGGHDLATDPLAARAIMSFIPDTPYLYEKLTAREYIHFVAGLYKTPPDIAARRMEELLEVFELADRADDLIEGYSHGMRQKTVMIAALVHDPQVLFLDEPTVGLDPRSAKLMRDVYRQLAARGATIFLSTHILEIAERMCDRIGIVQNGKLIALGTMDELRRLAAQNTSLEDIFLELTGGAAFAEIARVLA